MFIVLLIAIFIVVVIVLSTTTAALGSGTGTGTLSGNVTIGPYARSNHARSPMKRSSQRMQHDQL